MPMAFRFPDWTTRRRRAVGGRHARHVEGLETRRLLAAVLGEPFPAHAAAGGSQELPAAASDAAGNFVIVWQRRAGPDGDFDVYARPFAASGAPLGAEFVVHADLAGEQTAPSVAMADGGAFVVAWEDNNGGETDVYARRFDAAGIPEGPA